MRGNERERAYSSEFSPVLRLGRVLTTRKTLSDDQAYKLGERIFSNPTRLSDVLLSKQARTALSNFGISSIGYRQNSTARIDEIDYDIIPTIVINLPRISLLGPIRFGRSRTTNIEARVSLTVCPGDAKSKLWLRLSPSEDLSLDACSNFYATAFEIGQRALAVTLIQYNRQFVEPTLGNQFNEHYTIAIAIHACREQIIGKELHDIVTQIRKATPTRSALKELQVGDLSKAMQSMILRINSIGNTGALQRRRFLSYLSTRMSRNYTSAGYKPEDDEDSPIYTLGELSAYPEIATLVGVCFEAGATNRNLSPTASVIATAALANELGGTY